MNVLQGTNMKFFGTFEKRVDIWIQQEKHDIYLIDLWIYSYYIYIYYNSIYVNQADVWFCCASQRSPGQESCRPPSSAAMSCIWPSLLCPAARRRKVSRKDCLTHPKQFQLLRHDITAKTLFYALGSFIILIIFLMTWARTVALSPKIK